MPSLPFQPREPPLRANSAAPASCEIATCAGSSDGTSPKANDGTEAGPVNAAGRTALAVLAAAMTPLRRKRDEGFIAVSLRKRTGGGPHAGQATVFVSVKISSPSM